ncbi:hypothetical protein HK405_012239, partial [Cladochytrium tenue]
AFPLLPRDLVGSAPPPLSSRDQLGRDLAVTIGASAALIAAVSAIVWLVARASALADRCPPAVPPLQSPHARRPRRFHHRLRVVRVFLRLASSGPSPPPPLPPPSTQAVSVAAAAFDGELPRTSSTLPPSALAGPLSASYSFLLQPYPAPPSSVAASEAPSSPSVYLEGSGGSGGSFGGSATGPVGTPASLADELADDAQPQRLRQLLAAARATNRTLESRLRSLGRRRDALEDTAHALEAEVRAERESRFVIEHCLQDRLHRLELELEFKENEIAELRDRRRELEDAALWVGFDDDTPPTALAAAVARPSTPTIPADIPAQDAASVGLAKVLPPVAGRVASGRPAARDEDPEEGYGSEESFDGRPPAAPPLVSPPASLAPFAVPPAPCRRDSDASDATDASDSSESRESTGDVAFFQLAADRLAQEFVSDVSAATACADLKLLMLEHFRPPSQAAAAAAAAANAGAAGSDGGAALAAVIEALARVVEARWLRVVAAAGRAGRAATAVTAAAEGGVEKIVESCICKYANVIASRMDGPEDEERVLRALEAACLRRAPDRAGALHRPFLLALYRQELVGPAAVLTWFASPPPPPSDDDGGGGSDRIHTSVPGATLRATCAAFAKWLADEERRAEEDGDDDDDDDECEDEDDNVDGDDVPVGAGETDLAGSCLIAGRQRAGPHCRGVDDADGCESHSGDGDDDEDGAVEFGKRVTFGEVVE